MTNNLSPGKVFVPGGMPELTYVSRSNHALETELAQAKDNLCKLVTLTGPTKSGKTVLARKVFPRERGESIWIDGGSIDKESELWETILYQLEGSNEVEVTRSTHSSSDGSASIGSNVFGASATHTAAQGWTEGVTTRTSIPPKALAINLLNERKIPVVIDDFHYLNKDVQRSVIRALKQPVFDGLPVVFIAIPNRRYDAERVEGEMRLRIQSISVPQWTESELMEIPRVGFHLLRLEIPNGVVKRIQSECFGSPHLMQEFCKRIAVDIETNNDFRATDEKAFAWKELFHRCAEGTGRTVFDRLVRGPSERTDRMQRTLATGGTADIYQVVMLALAQISPGLGPVDYEDLRAAIRDLLNDSLPQKHEVTRVLEKMASIMSGDDNSVSVLDWQEENRQICVTDPFFAFFLRWGSVPDLVVSMQ